MGREALGYYVQCKVFKSKEILQIISSVEISGNDKTSWDSLYYDEIKFKITKWLKNLARVNWHFLKFQKYFKK